MSRLKGKLITFEGPEKSGKSTQARLLRDYFKQQGYKTLFVREPGSTKISEKIRRLLLDKKNNEMAMMTEMLLYMAARAQVIDEVIRPALNKGMLVLCDRFLDSTIAYQGYGAGMDIGMIKKVGLLATGGLTPDLTLLLDFWASSQKLKDHKRPDRIEIRSLEFHRRVRRGYSMLAKSQPRRIKVICVENDCFVTQQKIREIVIKCLLKK